MPILFGALCLGLAAAPAALGQDDERALTDQGIADAIDDEFLLDPAVPANDIDVRVSEGVVSLRGTTGNILSKERAERIAETVKGVRSVVNRIAVEPPRRRSDVRIEADIGRALAGDPATETWEIAYDVTDGEAVLAGVVESWQEKRIAERVVKGVRGIRNVTNNIVVRKGPARSDEEIRGDVVSALRWDVRVDDALITPVVSDGEVRLVGTVGSAAEKRIARERAMVPGAVAVDTTQLEVASWAREDELRKGKYGPKADEDIAKAVRDALAVDPRVPSDGVEVEVLEGVATLRGVVDNLMSKRSAARDARNTVGVIRVVNRIKVRPDPMEDAAIAGLVRLALAADPYVNMYEIDVEVVDGTVRLTGDADYYAEKSRADEIAAATLGVKAVKNRLGVAFDRSPLRYDPYVGSLGRYDYDWHDVTPYRSPRRDAEIEAAIEEQLWWSPFVDLEDVTVEVVEGSATLSGTVGSRAEKEAAEDNAYQGGAVWVENTLQVE
jgi:osmotically-inducible protein OsmY